MKIIVDVMSGDNAPLEIVKGAVMANIKIEVTEPNPITAVITKESAEKLGLAVGSKVLKVTKDGVSVVVL